VAKPEDLSGILPAIAEAAATVDIDHSRLAAVLDWVQYRRNFRAPVMVRPFGRDAAAPAGRADGPLTEIASAVRAGPRAHKPPSLSAESVAWSLWDFPPEFIEAREHIEHVELLSDAHHFEIGGAPVGVAYDHQSRSAPRAHVERDGSSSSTPPTAAKRSTIVSNRPSG